MKCKPDCTCGRHDYYSRSCQPGCTCGRHKVFMPKSEKLHTKIIHSRIVAARGKASEYGCVDCDKQAHDWAHIYGTGRSDINNYEPKCRSCHVAVDGNWEYSGGVKHYG